MAAPALTLQGAGDVVGTLAHETEERESDSMFAGEFGQREELLAELQFAQDWVNALKVLRLRNIFR